MGKKGDLSDFERGMVIGDRRGWSEYFKNCWSTGIFTHNHLVYREWSEKEKISSERQLCGGKCLVDVRGEWADWLEMIESITQITTRYNQDMQNTISEHTTRQTLKQMGYSSRRPHRVLLLSDKNRTQRIQFAQTHQNWKKLPGLMSLDFCCNIQM